MKIPTYNVKGIRARLPLLLRCGWEHTSDHAPTLVTLENQGPPKSAL